MGFVNHQGSMRKRERGTREKKGRSPGFGEREREREIKGQEKRVGEKRKGRDK